MLVIVALAVAPSIALAQDAGTRLRALDLFAGGVALDKQDEAGNTAGEAKSAGMAWGWEAGATARFKPWLGLLGAGGVQVVDGISVWHLATGPQVMTPIDVGNYYGSRLFAHALVGYARTSDLTPAAGGAELIVGGGADVFVFLRCQVDYVRPFVDGLPANNVRLFVAGVVPLCLSGCSGGEGINVAR